MKKEMDKIFEVRGLFYPLGMDSCRKYLKIKRIESEKDNKEDLVVIMMNPGSSRPKDNSRVEEELETKPDTTQYQIMRVMKEIGSNYAIVLNLSDIRNADSKKIYPRFKTNPKKCEHSVFSDTDINYEFLKQKLNPQSIFIFAWGVDEKLSNFAKQAIDVLYKLFGSNIKQVGIKHPLNMYGYFHPLQRTQTNRDLWVEIILRQIKELQITPKEFNQ